MSIYALVVGGIGNQLFIMSAAIAYSKKYNKRLCCYLAPWETRHNHFGLPGGFDGSVDQVYSEPYFAYKEIPYTEGNILIKGYFQSSKYFSKEIIDTISIPKSVNYSFPIIPEGKTPVCIHVRRGDYVPSIDFHYVNLDEYYCKAIEKIREIMREKCLNPHFLIFSDDIEYVTANTIGDVSSTERTIVDLCDKDCLNVMKECKHFIIPNSSFSWWGAMLGGYETVIAPKTWFGKNGPQDWQDIYESDWIVI